jgi:hypothetical protein
MALSRLVSAAALMLALAPAAAFAQSNASEPPPSYDQRFANQQNRIGAGVQDGSLTPTEASRLERGEQHIQNMDRRFNADGTLTDAEAQRLNRAQNVESQRIYNQRHDGQTANLSDPRFANQQQRIGAGIRDGSLTPREGARLEHQEGNIRRFQRNARSDGHVDPWERRRINQAYNGESRRIFRQRHDGQHR